MIQLQKRDDCALIVMRELALQRGDYVATHTIASQYDLSHALVKQAMLVLKKHHLVESREGSGGGYRLAKDPTKISFGDILMSRKNEAVEHACFADNHQCRYNSQNCPVQHASTRFYETISASLEQVSLAELLPRIR